MSPRHGTPVRGLSNVPRSSVRDQRFGRLFRDLPPAEFGDTDAASLAALTELGKSISQMTEGPNESGALDKAVDEPDGDENQDIPAGYTYLGQFIDHDITFDPASSLDRFNDPDALQDFRTPRLDLDSVYGSGPDDQPFLYDEDGAHLLLGRPDEAGGIDLPRNRHFIDGIETARHALIGDKRNDENLIVSQLHTVFLRFHNKVLDQITGARPAERKDFLRAQQIVRWHYQWIVLHDFLPRIVGEKTHGTIFTGGNELPVLTLYKPAGRYAFIPVEFSVAAYRYGHSQVRPSYALNIDIGAKPSKTGDGKPAPLATDNDGGIGKFFRIPIFSAANSFAPKGPKSAPDAVLDVANLNGFRQLPKKWSIDWRFFLDGVEPKEGISAQRSYKIDTQLVEPLASLPDHTKEKDPNRRALAILNLIRGWRFGLPSGQRVANYLGIDSKDILDDTALFDLDEENELAEVRKKILADFPVFKDNAPLWFYVLKEAEVQTGGSHLGIVGGKIVAEVLTGLVLEDGQSFLSQWPKWKPTLTAKDTGLFTLSDLVNIAIGRKPAWTGEIPPNP